MSYEEDKLLPCPFCGGGVNLERTIDQREWWGVVCRNTSNIGGTCAVQIRPSASKEAAIGRWNRRASIEREEAKDRRIEELERFIEKAKSDGNTIGDQLAFYDKLGLLSEIDELKAMVNELREALHEYELNGVIEFSEYDLGKTPAQSLNDVIRKAQEEMREACVLHGIGMLRTHSPTLAIEDIRSMPLPIDKADNL